MWLFYTLACPKTAEVSNFQDNNPAAQAILTEAAGDLDVGIRRRAIAALVQTTPEPAGGPWGLRGRWDPSHFVQRSTIGALAYRSQEPETQKLLKGWIQADPNQIDAYTRGYAALVLVQAAQQAGGSTTEIAELCKKEAEKVKFWASGSLYLASALAGDGTSTDAVLRLVESGEMSLEREFFEALASWQEPRLEAALVAGLPKMEPEVAGFAAGILLNLNPAEADPWFLAALSDPDEEHVLEVVDLLRELPSPKASGYLLLVKGEWAPDLAGIALVVRGERPMSGMKRWLVLGKEGLEDRELALEAARAAEQVWRRDQQARGSEAVAGWLRALGDHSDARLREAVVRALGAHQGEGDRAVIEMRMGDSVARVRLAAAEAMTGVRLLR